MFEGDSAEMCAGKFPLVSMGGRAEGLACADPGARVQGIRLGFKPVTEEMDVGPADCLP